MPVVTVLTLEVHMCLHVFLLIVVVTYYLSSVVYLVINDGLCDFRIAAYIALAMHYFKEMLRIIEESKK